MRDRSILDNWHQRTKIEVNSGSCRGYLKTSEPTIKDNVTSERAIGPTQSKINLI